MPQPTIESRRQRRLLLMSANAQSASGLKRRVAHGWEIVETLDLDTLGGLAELLQMRFVLVDLDASASWDPIEAIERIRTEFMVNVPVFGFNGAAPDHDRARIAGADRLFSGDELAARLPQFCDQFGWQ
jgi:hypothetical protein